MKSKSLAGDLLDVGAVDAEVVQLTGIETVQLTHGLVVQTPVAESADRVHFSPPFVGSIVSMPRK
ncbi:hypothetical protein MPLB_630021 [Mesorhizobium sp. ORS 3324]|nr:hypothetical protein MPLB_630021 [Mesorhizobium sp. ORS 3324]